jgi:hypothetical protein
MKTFKNLENEDYLMSSLMALGKILEVDEECIETLTSDQEAMNKLFQLLRTENQEILLQVLRAYGIISSSSTSSHIKALVSQKGFVEMIIALLDHESKLIRGETTWLLSNILADSCEHCLLFINYEGFVEKIFSITKTDEIEVPLSFFFSPFLFLSFMFLFLLSGCEGGVLLLI